MLQVSETVGALLVTSCWVSAVIWKAEVKWRLGERQGVADDISTHSLSDF